MKNKLLNIGERKVIRVGSSKCITIPPVWSKSADIEIGDVLNLSVTPKGNLLLEVVK